jgi:hypothetical protein
VEKPGISESELHRKVSASLEGATRTENAIAN